MNNKKVTYYTNPYKKTTTAVITNCHMDAINTFNEKIASCVNSSLRIGSKYDERFIMPYQMYATVTCRDGDEYNEEEGRRRALKKLSEKYNRSLYKRLINIYNYLTKILIKESEFLDRRVPFWVENN